MSGLEWGQSVPCPRYKSDRVFCYDPRPFGFIGGQDAGFAMQRMYLILSIMGWAWLAVALVAWIVMTARQEAGRGRANGSEHEQ